MQEEKDSLVSVPFAYCCRSLNAWFPLCVWKKCTIQTMASGSRNRDASIPPRSITDQPKELMIPIFVESPPKLLLFGTERKLFAYFRTSIFLAIEWSPLFST